MRPLYPLIGLALSVFAGLAGCSNTPASRAQARTVTHRDEVPAGPRALGDVGDLLLENDKVRVVIQGPGDSRGFGVYGGSLLDAARVDRNQRSGSSAGGVGSDQFGELFPSFFLQAVAVDKVEVISSGADGGPARVRASGTAGDFLELVGYLNRAITGSNERPGDATSTPKISYATTYELEPGANWLRLIFRVENISPEPLVFPGSDATGLLSVIGLPTEGFTVPLGDVALFGATSKLFVPGAGYDLRAALDRSYDAAIDWPAFPGVVADWVASSGDGVSYGMMVEGSPDNFVIGKQATYAPVAPFGVTDRSMLIPFVTGGFTGLFHRQAPTQLAAGDAFEVTKYFIIGDGDVGSVLDTLLPLQGVATGDVRGKVHERLGSAPADEVTVEVRRKAGDRYLPYGSYAVTAGSFAGRLPAGDYEAVVAGEGRPLSTGVAFSVKVGEASSLDLTAEGAGRIVVRIVDERGQPMPGKATAVAFYAEDKANQDPRTFLYDKAAGEHERTTDLVPDTADPLTRRYIETVDWAAAGQAELLVRPLHRGRQPRPRVRHRGADGHSGAGRDRLGHPPRRPPCADAGPACRRHAHPLDPLHRCLVPRRLPGAQPGSRGGGDCGLYRPQLHHRPRADHRRTGAAPVDDQLHRHGAHHARDRPLQRLPARLQDGPSRKGGRWLVEADT
jgi:hypothetical protein